MAKTKKEDTPEKWGAIGAIGDPEIPAPAKEKKPRPDVLDVECPNCRAAAGKPCHWKDGSTCYAREVYFKKKAGK